MTDLLRAISLRLTLIDETLLRVFTFILGAMLGSFLNALIYRLPREVDIVFARSSCTKCQNLIPWYHNIPLLSFLWLKGKCSSCKAKISVRYPLIELVTGLLVMFLSHSLALGQIWVFVFQATVLCLFIAHFMIDLEHQILPDSLNLLLAVLFLIQGLQSQSWQMVLLGGAVGALLPLSITWVFYKLRGVVGLGGGDIKLYGALGLVLGPYGVVQIIFLSCFLGTIVGLILIATRVIKKDQPIPFGPFIIIVASIALFFPHGLRWMSSPFLP